MRAIFLAFLLLLVATPLAGATHEDDTCTPWVPALDGRDSYCVDDDSSACPLYKRHDGRFLDYRVCLIPA